LDPVVDPPRTQRYSPRVARFDLRAAFYGGPGFTLYHAWGPNSAMPLNPHFHDEYLICAQIRGTEECQVSGKTQRFDPGDVVLINPQQVHTGNAQANEELEYISVYVDRGVVRHLAEQLGASTRSPEFTVVTAKNRWPLIQRLHTLLELVREQQASSLYPITQTPSEEDVELPQMAKLVGPSGEPALGDDHDHHDPIPGAATATRREVSGLDVESALHDLIMLAFEEFSNIRQPALLSSNRVGHRKIARAVDYIRDLDPATNPASVSLDQLADVAGLSKYHFLRQFSQVVGMTPGAYLRTLRLCHAARKLRTTALPILDIALSVGFADHPSFSRAFARHMGMTPSEYQKLGPL